METPSVVVESLLAGDARIGDLSLRPLTLTTFLLLSKINSPLIRGEVCDAMDTARALVIMSSSSSDILDALKVDRFESFVCAACERVPLSEMKKAPELLADLVRSSMEPAKEYSFDEAKKNAAV